MGIAAALFIAFLGAGALVAPWWLTDTSGLGPTDSVTVKLAPPSGAPAPTDDELSVAMERLEARALDLGAADVDVQRDVDVLIVGMEGISGDPHRIADLLAARGELRFRPVLQVVQVDQVDEPDSTEPAAQETGADSDSGPDRPGECGPADPETLAAADPSQLTVPEADHPCGVAVLAGIDGERYIVGPTQATSQVIERAEAKLEPTGGWVVSLLFRAGPEGIDQFNEAASLCFNEGPQCPTRMLAIVMDSQVQSAPMLQEPRFERDAVIVTWRDIDEQQARDLALLLRHSILPIDLEVESATSTT